MAASRNFPGIGPYTRPSRTRVNQAALSALALGGRVVSGIHRSERTIFGGPDDRLHLLRKEPMPPQWTCSCGQAGIMIELPPSALPLTEACGHGSQAPSGTTRICVRCDAGHLMPRLTPEEVN